MDIQRGFRTKLEQNFTLASPITVRIAVDGSAVYDITCFGLDSSDKLSDDRYMIFYNQLTSPRREITMAQNGTETVFTVSLTQLPQTIQKLAFTISIDGNLTMTSLRQCVITLEQAGREAIRLPLSGANFSKEKAIVAVELYIKETWRMAAIASGFNGGLPDLLKAYGGEESGPSHTPAPTPAPAPYIPPKPAPMPDIAPKVQAPIPTPAPVPTPPPVQPGGRVVLEKGKRVNLQKNSAMVGDIVINLNWNQHKRGLFSSGAIDLDLGCLFEMADGRKSTIQALGNAFGSLSRPPFIALDGDDRTGSNAAGENLRISGDHIGDIRRILVYTFIYEGVTNWKQADGVVTIKCPGSPDLIIHMDEYNSRNSMCALALLENTGSNSFAVEKLIRFFDGHESLDRAFGWGLRWKAGRK